MYTQKTTWEDEVKDWTAEDALEYFQINLKFDPIQLLRLSEESIRDPLHIAYAMRFGLIAVMRRLGKIMDRDEYEKLCIKLLNTLWNDIWHDKDENIGTKIANENRPKIF